MGHDQEMRVTAVRTEIPFVIVTRHEACFRHRHCYIKVYAYSSYNGSSSALLED